MYTVSSLRGNLILMAGLTLAACNESNAPLGTRGASADLAALTIPITSCGTQITAPGTYQLANDLLACPGHGVEILSSDVTLNFAGHAIRGAPGSALGLNVGGGVHGGVNNVRIIGPGRVESFQEGIFCEQVTHSMLTGLTVRLNLHGLALNKSTITGDLIPSSDDSIVMNSFSDNIAHGVTMNGALNSVFRNNLSFRNGFGPFGGHGFFLFDASGIDLEGNSALGNHDYGIYVLYGNSQNVVMGNLAWNNHFTDLEDDNTNCGSDTWRENRFRTANQSCIR